MAQSIPNISELESRSDVTVAQGRIDAKTRGMLAAAYFRLYQGLSCYNWARPGTTLADAWKNALAQINKITKTYPADNPAAAYLGRINAAVQRQWPQKIMDNPRRDGKLAVNNSKTTEFVKYSQEHIKSAQAMIVILIARFNIRFQANVQSTKTEEKRADAPAPQSGPAYTARPQATSDNVAQPVSAHNTNTAVVQNAAAQQMPIAKPAQAAISDNVAQPVATRAASPQMAKPAQNTIVTKEPAQSDLGSTKMQRPPRPSQFAYGTARPAVAPAKQSVPTNTPQRSPAPKTTDNMVLKPAQSPATKSTPPMGRVVTMQQLRIMAIMRQRAA